MSPKNLPENVTISYRQTPWFIPADKVDVDLNELYRMPKIKINGKLIIGLTVKLLDNSSHLQLRKLLKKRQISLRIISMRDLES